VSLRVRLALLFAVATAIGIGAAGTVFVHQLRDNLYDTMDSELHDRLSSTAEQLAEHGDRDLGPATELVQLRTIDGAVVGSTRNAEGLVLSPRRLDLARAGNELFTTEVGGDHSRVLASSTPVAGTQMIIVVGTRTEVADDAVDRVRLGFLVMGPIAVLLAGFAASVLAAAALQPVERMRREAESISEHDPERRLAVPATRDELAALGRTINDLLGRLHRSLERERRFVADAGHELRTPLAILRGELELAARPGRDVAELREAVAEAGEEAVRLSALVEDLLLLARADNEQPIVRAEAVQLPELLDRAIRRGRARDRRPPVDVQCPERLQVTADPDRLLQVLTNLLDNAIGHTPAGTPVAVRAEQPDGGGAVIEILDEGPGLPAEFLPVAFERFQRAEQARGRDTGGTGLGLAIVRTVVAAHGGTVGIDNRPAGGARVTVRLPPRST
jgi:two-component system, OmpR family, sensor kinase